MTDEKLKYIDGVFVGKVYGGKTFDNKDGSKTKSMRYTFNVEEKNWNFWGYDTTKGADTLTDQEGELFKLGYIEKENPMGEYPIKVVKFITKSEGGKKNVVSGTDSQQISSSNSSNTSLNCDKAGPGTPLIPQATLDRITEAYMANTPKEKRNLSSFIGIIAQMDKLKLMDKGVIQQLVVAFGENND